MQIMEIKKIAKDMGIKAEKMQKMELIRAIQSKEGNFPCFGTAKDYCDQLNCSFRDDCLGKKYN